MESCSKDSRERALEEAIKKKDGERRYYEQSDVVVFLSSKKVGDRY